LNSSAFLNCTLWLQQLLFDTFWSVNIAFWHSAAEMAKAP